MRRLVIVSFFALFLTSCGRTDEISGHRFTITREDGVEVAVTTGGPRYQTDLFTYEKVLRILPDEEQPETLLHLPTAILPGDDENYYVCDNGNYRIAVFDAEGRFVRSFGRKGGGPGEFEAMALLGLRDDVLTIFDTVQNRVSLLTAEGRFIRSVSTVAGEPARQVYPLEDDQILGLYETFEMHGREEWSGMKGVVQNVDRDTVGTIEVPPVHIRNWLLSPARVSYPVYFTAYPRIGYAWGRGLFSYDPREPELHWHDVGGVLRTVFRVQLPKVAPPAEDRRIYEDLWDERVARAQESGDRSTRIVRDNLVFADYVPFWTVILVDDPGYSWLGIFEPNSKKEASGGTAFRVLSPEGEYLGDTRWPFVAMEDYLIRLTDIAKGRLLAIERDPETQEWIPTVYRLIPAAAGFSYH